MFLGLPIHRPMKPYKAGLFSVYRRPEDSEKVPKVLQLQRACLELRAKPIYLPKAWAPSAGPLSLPEKGPDGKMNKDQ